LTFYHPQALLFKHKYMNSPERQFNALTPDPEKKDASNAPEVIIEKTPIAETETDVVYLGVTLEKSKSGDDQFVPKREQYADFINDKEVALPLQRDIAIAFLSGEPLLVDGGTSLGKTTTVRKMAAELGWEIHYANLNGATDVEDLMGRYIPNPHKSKPEDPEYIFADGKVTSGLRQEEGKTKIVILDEFNASAPNILIRLHEVLDALERGGDVILSEDASEAVPVNKERTKIIALMNPPGKGYFGREPLDPAQLRRWVYKKLPSELPESTFSYSTDALFGAEPTSQNVTPDMFIRTREGSLTPEQLPEIPGLIEVLEKYKEFHKAAKELLKNRKVAEDQPQAFTFDDRMEPRRVRDFVLRFYTGDINETFQQALRYYYSNKLENKADRDMFEELIRVVEYKPTVVPSRRKGIEAGPERNTEEIISESFEIAEKITKKMEQFLTEGSVSKNSIALGLTGVGTAAAMEMRKQFLTEGSVSKNSIALGLTGVGTAAAMEMRKQFLTEGSVPKNTIAFSLAGVGTAAAMEMRKQFLTEGSVSKNSIVLGLTGVGTAAAMEMRKQFLTDGVSKNYIALGLTGVGTAVAMEMRKQFLTDGGVSKNSIALGLAGVGTAAAMEMRKQLLTEGSVDKNYIARSLAGVGTAAAMEMRKQLLTEGSVDKNYIARSLAGANNKESFEFRENNFNSDDELYLKSFITESVEIDAIICRYGFEGDMSKT